eukprot:8593849-Lingulodinium_polyedra.AAC.1
MECVWGLPLIIIISSIITIIISITKAILAQAASRPAAPRAPLALMPMALDGQRRRALDAARAAVLAAHAASGLAAAQSREATRLLRSAEGLCRAAAAVLAAPAPAPSAPATAEAAAAPLRRRRPRRRAARAEAGGQRAMDTDSPEAGHGQPAERSTEEGSLAALPHPVFVAAAGAQFALATVGPGPAAGAPDAARTPGEGEGE